MPNPIQLVDLIGRINAGKPGRFTLLSALLGGGVGAVTGSSDSRLSDFLKGTLIGGGAGLGAHVGAGRGGFSAASRVWPLDAVRSSNWVPPTERAATAQLLAGILGGGAIGGGLGGAGGSKIHELLHKNSAMTKSSGFGVVLAQRFYNRLYSLLFGGDPTKKLIEEAVKTPEELVDEAEGVKTAYADSLYKDRLASAIAVLWS